MTRFLIASYLASPFVLMACLAWLYFSEGIAVIFTICACMFCGYVVGRFDDPPKHSIRWSWLP